MNRKQPYTQRLCRYGAACYEGGMKKILKWVFRLILLLVVLLVVLALGRNAIARPLLEKEIRRATGLNAVVGRVNIGLTAPTLYVENLRLLDTAEFGGATFVDVPELQIEYDWVALRSRIVRLRAVRVNISQLNAVRNKDGRCNLLAFREDTLQRLAAPGSRTAGLQFGSLDSLTVTLGRFQLTDNQDPARTQEEWIGLKNATLKDVKSPADLELLFAPLLQQRHLKVLVEHVLNEVLKPPPPAPKPASAGP